MEETKGASDLPESSAKTPKAEPEFRKLTVELFIEHSSRKRPMQKTALKDWDQDHSAMTESCAISLGFPTDKGPICPVWSSTESRTNWNDIQFRIEPSLSHDVVLGSKALEALREDQLSGGLACFARLVSEQEQRQRMVQEARNRMRQQREKEKEKERSLAKLGNPQKQSNVVAVVPTVS